MPSCQGVKGSIQALGKDAQSISFYCFERTNFICTNNSDRHAQNEIMGSCNLKDIFQFVCLGILKCPQNRDVSQPHVEKETLKIFDELKIPMNQKNVISQYPS